MLEKNLTDDLALLVKDNEELLVYSLSLEKINNDTMLDLIKKDVISIETILGKLTLLTSFVKEDARISSTLFVKLREYSFQGQN